MLKLVRISLRLCMMCVFMFNFGLSHNEKWVRVIVFNTTLHNISVISWRSVVLMEETGVPGENDQQVASH